MNLQGNVVDCLMSIIWLFSEGLFFKWAESHYFMLAFKGAVYDLVPRTGSVVCIKKFQMNQRRSLILYVFDLCWNKKSNQRDFFHNKYFIVAYEKPLLFQGPNLLSKGKEGELDWGCKVYEMSVIT